MPEARENSKTRFAGQTSSAATSQPRWIAVSITLHLAILSMLLYARSPELAPIDRPGDTGGHLLQLTYLPGSATSRPKSKAPKRNLPKPAPRISPVEASSTPAAPAAPAPAAKAASNDEATEGTDALGNGDITVALVRNHPSPHPDLAQLPAGTRGDVIVDVVIDETGRIAKCTMTHGLGHGVDQTVLAAIQQWTFQPATRNGAPVTSEQELLFHYERA
jgi:protein TonB